MNGLRHILYRISASDSAILAGRPYIVSLFEHQEFF
jgi:hypothetical protein